MADGQHVGKMGKFITTGLHYYKTAAKTISEKYLLSLKNFGNKTFRKNKFAKTKKIRKNEKKTGGTNGPQY